MTITTNARVAGQQAPCGRTVDGTTYQDQDDEVVVTQRIEFACGCQTTRHEYHDGSVSMRVVRHDGHVLMDQLLDKE